MSTKPFAASLDEEVRNLDGSLGGAVDELDVPAFVIDTSGRLRWLNGAARDIAGNAVGRPFVTLVSRTDRLRARTVFTRKLLGTTTATRARLTLVAADGSLVPAEVSSAAIRDDGRVVGVFGLATVLEPSRREKVQRAPQLTARQREVLRLLAAGKSTSEIAQELALSPETVRNHIRHLLRALGVHSRLQAVVKAVDLGVIESAGTHSV